MSTPSAPPVRDTPFVNEFRLGARQWLLVLGTVALAILVTPWIWERAEQFPTGPDYRIPYSLSNDYWLFNRRLNQLTDPKQIAVLGDSVIWGEYVLPDGTLSHFLNRETGDANRFVNAGVNGLFPLAMEGLVEHYGSALRGRKVLLHCNLLWMSSPRADLQAGEEGDFNHPQLVPQFSPQIPSYKADATERINAVIERNIPFFTWVKHVQDAYFGQKNIPGWTLSDDGSYPPKHPNAYKNPFRQVTLAVPTAAAVDPMRGPTSKRHQPWTETSAGPARFAWVAPEGSLQLAAFQRTVRLLRERGSDVFVLVGPFNEHMVAEPSRAGYAKLRDAIDAWLTGEKLPHAVPATLPSEHYADASHPLTEGYQQLARQLRPEPTFSAWLGR